MGQNLSLAVLLLVVAVAAPLVGRRLLGDYLHPSALTFAAWSGTLGLFFLHLFPYPDLSGATLAVIAGSVAALVGVSALSTRFRRPDPASGTILAPSLCVAAMAVLGVLGIAWYIRDVTSVLGAGVFFVRPSPIRGALSDGTVSSRYLVLQFLCVATPILAAALALTGRALRWWVWVLVALCTSGTLISTDRTQFFVVVLTVYVMWVLSRGPRLSAARFLMPAATTLLLLGSYFIAIGVWQGKTPELLNVEVRLPSAGGSAPAADPPGAAPAAGAPTSPTATTPPATPPPSGSPTPAAAPAGGGMGSWLQANFQRFSTIYLYATGSYAALDVLVRAVQPWTYGAQIAYPVARVLERLGVVSGVPSNIPPFVPLGLTSGRDVSFNSYTFLYYPISDFGPIAAIPYSAAIGLLAAFVYGRYSSNRDSGFWLLCMGHLSAGLVLSVFVNKFNNTASLYIFVWSAAPFLVARAVALAGRAGPPPWRVSASRSRRP